MRVIASSHLPALEPDECYVNGDRDSATERRCAGVMDTWVIKLPQADKAEEPILIRVSRKPGGQKLDLDLLATDGESAWRTKRGCLYFPSLTSC